MENLVSRNARPVVLIADKLAQSTVDALGDGVEIRWVDGPNRSELLAALPEADAVLVRSATTIDAEALAVADNLKIIGRAGVGLITSIFPRLLPAVSWLSMRLPQTFILRQNMP